MYLATFVSIMSLEMTQWFWNHRSSRGWRYFNVFSKSVNRYIITLYFVLCVQRSVFSVQCFVLYVLCFVFCVLCFWSLGFGVLGVTFWGYVRELCSASASGAPADALLIGKGLFGQQRSWPDTMASCSKQVSRARPEGSCHLFCAERRSKKNKTVLRNIL